MLGLDLSEAPGDRMNGTDAARLPSGAATASRGGPVAPTKIAEITIGRLTGSLALMAAVRRPGRERRDPAATADQVATSSDAAAGFRTAKAWSLVASGRA